ncbi:MAG: nitroreductase [Succinivibrio sp.]|nr:nitroreductase [Succinivibrio sp.]
MNEIIKSMLERRSIRKFTSEMPSKADLEQIIEAGLYAPNGKAHQSSIIVAVTRKELRDELSEVNRQIGGWEAGFDPFYGAPAILIVLAEKAWPTHVYDGSLTMGNMLLAAHALGLGSIWIHRAREEFERPEYQQLLKDLGISGELEGIAHCAVGYLDGERPRAAERREGRVFWIE